MKLLNANKLGSDKVLKLIGNGRSKSSDVEGVVKGILAEIRERGDEALKDFTRKFDDVELKSLRISDSEIKEAYTLVDAEIVKALRSAKENIEKFHKAVLVRKSEIVETVKGVKVWREFRPIEKVGLYVPGGRAAYPSTALMLGVPAKVAGCERIVMCTPCGASGKCNPAVLVAADICGIDEIYKIGGAQAVAAMAYGTSSIPKVYKIFGPGNQYVTTAKMLVYGEVDIDMPAGPSEVLIITDETAEASFVAADLLSQLEHGTESQSVLLTFSVEFAKEVLKEIEAQVLGLSRAAIIRESLKRSFAVVVDSSDQAVEIANSYAPEHLEIITKDREQILARIVNAGSVFLGEYTSEPLGDYATGANHTLPTSGYSKMFSALSADSFGKMMQVQEVSKEGVKTLEKTVITLAYAEGFDAHAKAVEIRRK